MKFNQSLMDEIMRIKLNVLQSSSPKKIKSILVTSSKSGEGSSFVASELAVSLSFDNSQKILLVDGNTRKSQLHHWFSQNRENGFSDFLQGNGPLDDMIRPTSFQNIYLLTAGTPIHGENNLRALSGICPTTKVELEKNFDWVIYDSAPLNDFPDTLLMTPLSDGVILVIFAEKTRPSVVQKAKTSLELINANILGGVLNGRKHAVPEFIYKRL